MTEENMPLLECKGAALCPGETGSLDLFGIDILWAKYGTISGNRLKDRLEWISRRDKKAAGTHDPHAEVNLFSGYGFNYLIASMTILLTGVPAFMIGMMAGRIDSSGSRLMPIFVWCTIGILTYCTQKLHGVIMQKKKDSEASADSEIRILGFHINLAIANGTPGIARFNEQYTGILCIVGLYDEYPPGHCGGRMITFDEQFIYLHPEGYSEESRLKERPVVLKRHSKEDILLHFLQNTKLPSVLTR